LGLAGIVKSQHIDTGASPAAAGLISGFEKPVNLYQIGFDATWELDLFGKVRRSVEAADARSQSAIEARNDLLVSLQAEVAQTYFQLRAAQVLRKITADEIAAQRDVADLTQNRFEHGLPERGRGRPPARSWRPCNRTAALRSIGRHVSACARGVDGPNPGIVGWRIWRRRRIAAHSGIDSGRTALLARAAAPGHSGVRSDAALRHGPSGVAVASLFPDVSLTGTLGLRNLSPGYLFDWDSKFYTLSPAVSLPLFQGGALVANVHLSRAQAAEAELNYHKTVLNALQEVEDGLTALHQDALRTASLRDSLGADHRALEIDTDLYRPWPHHLYQCADRADPDRPGRASNLANALLTQSTDIVKLYKALGGGWQDNANQTAKDSAQPWSGRQDSNLRPSGPKPDALPS
jgi:multidrug efflux system outer membrane protein